MTHQYLRNHYGDHCFYADSALKRYNRFNSGDTVIFNFNNGCGGYSPMYCGTGIPFAGGTFWSGALNGFGAALCNLAYGVIGNFMPPMFMNFINPLTNMFNGGGFYPYYDYTSAAPSPSGLLESTAPASTGANESTQTKPENDGNNNESATSKTGTETKGNDNEASIKAGDSNNDGVNGNGNGNGNVNGNGNGNGDSSINGVDVRNNGWKDDPENLQKLIEANDIPDNQVAALKDTLADALKDLKKGDNEYGFTNDYNKLKQLELLCKLDPSVVVQVVYNGKAPDKWIKGSISNVQKAEDNSDISFKVNCKADKNASIKATYSFKITKGDGGENLKLENVDENDVIIDKSINYTWDNGELYWANNTGSPTAKIKK